MTDNDLTKSAKGFIGDKKTMMVHDTSKGLCTVDQEAAVPFDTVDEAHVADFKNCPKCLSGLFIHPVWSIGAGPITGGGTFVQKEVPRGTVQNKMVSGSPEKK